VVANGDVLSYVMYGLFMQIYAGENSTGIASLNDNGGGGIVVKKSLGKAIDVFPQYDPELKSQTIIGHNGCAISEVQPLALTKNGQKLAFVTDASQETTAKIKQRIRSTSNILNAVKNILLSIKDPFSLIILSPEHGLIAARNSGIKPLTIGRIELDGLEGFYLASQSGVMIEGTFLEAVEPGNMIIVNASSYQDIAVAPSPDRSHCINEVNYRQRPGNICGHREVSQIRIDIGRRLGEVFRKTIRFRKPKLYRAIPVLEGGRSFALGFGQTSGIPTDIAGSVRNFYSVPPHMRRIALQVGLPENFALDPLPNVKGLKIVLIDDQIRSGRKIAHMARKCRRYGAKDVLAVVGSIGRTPCPYGDAAYKDKRLIGRRMSKSKIAAEIGVSKLISLELEELIEAIGTPERLYCAECLRDPHPSS
jgi:glutamine phosphoribosylpyrophosphate amidotransferase